MGMHGWVRGSVQGCRRAGVEGSSTLSRGRDSERDGRGRRGRRGRGSQERHSERDGSERSMGKAEERG